jgi:oxalate decarboxylase/phosphoglucose isomerase-like protein (cupin superfamily)
MPPELSFRSIEKMRDVLMDPSAKSPETFYYMIRGSAEKGNVTVINGGTADGEYVKTYGHYHVLDFIETYKIISGEGILLIQMRRKDASGWLDDQLDCFKALRVKVGDSIDIPAWSGHALVNTGPGWLVTNDGSPYTTGEDSGAPAHADYEVVKRMRGLAYYVVEENGKPALVKNPAYPSVPPAVIEDFMFKK